MAISEINDKSLAASAVNLATTTVTGILPAANTVANLSPGNNLIINGAMQVAQRTTSVTGVGNNVFMVDRFSYERAGGGITAAFNSEQSTDAPSGFAYSLKMTATTGQTLGSSGGRYINAGYTIEGYDASSLIDSQGTFTLSFYVKMSNTGDYSVLFKPSRHDVSTYASEFTVNSANTWEKKTVTVTISTAYGTWNTTTGAGLHIKFVLDADDDVSTASNNAWVNTNSYGAQGQEHGNVTTNATFQFAGVQLESGTVATPFNYRSYGQELALCQRYYQTFGGGNAYETVCLGVTRTSSDVRYQLLFSSDMRASPTLVIIGSWRSLGTNIVSIVNANMAINTYSTRGVDLLLTTNGHVAGQSYLLNPDNDVTARLQFSAEL